MIRLFYATDVHGSTLCFLKFLNAHKFYKADVIILGGDITGKSFIPIIKRTDGTYKAQFLGRQLVLKSQQEVSKLKNEIENIGCYAFETDLEEMQALIADNEKQAELFKRLIIQRVQKWIEIAEERLKGTNTKCFITPGNDDILDIDYLLNQSEVIINPEDKVIEINSNLEMISSGYSNITPWNCPRDVSEEKLKEKIEAMVAKVKDFNNCIFNFHCPPYGTPLDLAPKLDKNLKPIISTGGQPIFISVGSHTIREVILKYQPMLGLHGHIHESRGYVKLGRTLCLNPGSEYGEGILRGVIINIDKEVKNFQFTSG
jgi:Icc-related predicted phosphoesterase